MAARNVFWNYCGTATGLLLGFVVTPALVRRLGETDYGIWILLGSVVGYFNLIDLGLRGSVARNMAMHRARHEILAVRQVLTSALTLLSGIGVIALLGVAALQAAFFTLFEVPADRIPEVRTALLIVGVNLALTFPLAVFDGTLWAHERFDALNWVDIPVHLMRAVLTLLLVGDAGGLVTLAWITLTLTMVAATAKACWSFHENRELRVAPRYFSMAALGHLFDFGIWGFVIQTARVVRTQAAPVIIGSLLGVPLVTPFALARRLQDYAQMVMVTGTGVFTPIATRLHAVDHDDAQRVLFLTGGKICSAVAFGFLGLFLCFGGPFLSLWIGPSVEHAARYLAVLAVGEVVFLSQSITGNMVLSKARHRPLAVLAVIEAALGMSLAWVLTGPYGTLGACVGLAVPQFLCGGLGTLVHGCRVLGVTLREYLEQVTLPVVLRSLLPIAAAWLSVDYMPPERWLTLALGAGAYGFAYVLIVGSAIVDYRRVPGLIAPHIRRFVQP